MRIPVSPSPQRPNFLRGFSLVEVLVALAIVLILAAVVLPSLASYLDQQRIDVTSQKLVTVGNVIFKNGAATGFFDKVLNHPGRLSHLTNPITATTTDLCNVNYSAGDVTRWTANAPFVNFYIDPAGMPTGVGLANDLLTRVQIPAATGSWFSRIDIPTATVDDAVALDATADGGNGQNAGNIRWTAPVGGITTIQALVPINNQCP